MSSYGPKLSSYGQQRLWSDWADAQADLSLRWAHSFCWFCHVAAQIICPLQVRPKKNVLFPESRPTLLFCPRPPNFFHHNLHSVKISTLRSISQGPFRFHFIVSVQRQHGKTGEQVNHVIVFSQCTYRGPVLPEMFRYYRWLYYIDNYTGQFYNTVPSVSLFKVPND